jgi:hypothetical protein
MGSVYAEVDPSSGLGWKKKRKKIVKRKRRIKKKKQRNGEGVR